MPPQTPENKRSWWTWLILAGPGWVFFGAIKQIVGLFLAVYLIANVADSAGVANQPVHQFLEIYQNFLPGWLAMTLAVALVVISRSKSTSPTPIPDPWRGPTPSPASPSTTPDASCSSASTC